MTQKNSKATSTSKTAKKDTATQSSKTKASETAKANKAAASTKTSVARSNASDKKTGPIAFSLDDVEAVVASREKEAAREAAEQKPAKPVAAVKKTQVVDATDKPVEKRVHGAASLSDILGFNPAEKKNDTNLEEEEIPKKWEKYYRLLLDLRRHVRDELDLHTADTLKHSSREDSGDLASYGNHQADAGTDSFDRDFALSLVSSEQDALNEVEEAIQRIKNGTYGVCEVTGQPINKERLEAVPFARFSVEGQAEYEKNKRRKIDRNAGGLFGDTSDAPKLASDDEDED